MADATPPAIRLGQVGIGYWGRNLLRSLLSLPDADVVRACDRDESIRRQAAAAYPDLALTAAFDDLLDDERIEAIVIATETPTHFVMAEAALRAGKHVLVEKPLAQTVEQAERLVSLAEENQLCLMVGHLLRYHPAFEYVERLAREGALGELRYLCSTRVNLGIVRERENAFDSLAPHDLATSLALLGEPVSVSATGAAYLRPGVQDVVFASVHFEGGRLAHLHTSWLDPQKVRKVTLVGSQRMVVIDDMEPAEKVRVYDKGLEFDRDSGYASYQEALSIRSGDVVIPRIPVVEPLRNECAHFLQCVRTGERPRTDGREGLAVVRLLDAARRSLEEEGARIPV
jgi:predicted dehydrogenase